MLANTCYAAFCPAASIADFVYDFAGDVYLLIRQGASLYVYVSSYCGRHAGKYKNGVLSDSVFVFSRLISRNVP